jgi:glyoxylase-like metal-dependent hydrolase (beta-lactamase superfamily II)
MAVWIPWAGVLVCGDYLSPVEIPTPEGSLERYLATLARLEPLVRLAEHVVPGHGGPLVRDQALAILAEDRAYLDALQAGRTELPATRRDAEQRRLHDANVARLGRA